MKRIYCISGLGADHRAFRNLSIDNYELVPVSWVPFSSTDDIPGYARKLAATIKEKDPIIVGLSFGGMLAVEIAQQQPTKKTFLISSAKNRNELGGPGGFIRWVIKNGLIPAKLLATPNRFILERFGANTIDEKQLMSGIISDSDGSFMKWALKALLTWSNTITPHNVTHIHGTADKIIAAENVHPNHWIEGGSHIMIYNRAGEVSRIISDCIAH